MKKFICVHGHFYQPPRENPWTGEVDEEPSAAPFHDWNERIVKECYAANTKAQVLNRKGQVAKYVNNFAKISFDIGPTLFAWLVRKDPITYRAILDADRESVKTRGGHGNALAQIYNHVIMPLASKRDKITQIIWGIREFEFHYKRKPEGMWLSETAVDRETLEILADEGIKFTVLAPAQAKRVRPVGFGAHWRDIPHEAVDPKHPYRVILKGGRQIHIFFYDGPISRAIAFEGLLSNGDNFDHRLLHAFSRRQGAAQLVSTATDGESFGHHHKFGEMAVAYGLQKIEDERLATLTNYGEFLERFGSRWEVDLHESSSWSCPHGVERWRADCGCRIHHDAKWNQKWRQPLREAFDLLKAAVDEAYESGTRDLLKNPWQARNDYIDVVVDPSVPARKNFLAKSARKTLSAGEEKKVWDLLEAQKFSMFMYTSCGWFFDDLSGIEPVQVMKFAARAIELAQPHCRKPLEELLLKSLRHAKSNVPEHGTGADIFENMAKAAKHPKSAVPAGN